MFLTKNGCYDGKLVLNIGPKYSGKTSELIRHIKKYKMARKKTLFISYKTNLSPKTNETIKAHNGLYIKGVRTNDLEKVANYMKDVDVVAIDDFHMFDGSSKLGDDLANDGKIVMMSGSIGDENGNAYEEVIKAIPLSEQVIQLKALCNVTTEEAIFNHRVSDKVVPLSRRAKFANMSISSKLVRLVCPVGRLHLIIGPMFSGKTSMLITTVKSFASVNKKIIMIKYNKDIRYSDTKCISRDFLKIKAVNCGKNLSQVNKSAQSVDVIGIDEGQFFEDINEFSQRMVLLGKIVIIAGLDGTFERKPFGNLLRVISNADKITKLTAVCMVTESMKAPFSKRITNEKEVEVIGDKDKYIAVSRKGYFLKSSPIKDKMVISPQKTIINKKTDIMIKMK